MNKVLKKLLTQIDLDDLLGTYADNNRVKRPTKNSQLSFVIKSNVCDLKNNGCLKIPEARFERKSQKSFDIKSNMLEISSNGSEGQALGAPRADLEKPFVIKSNKTSSHLKAIFKGLPAESKTMTEVFR